MYLSINKILSSSCLKRLFPKKIREYFFNNISQSIFTFGASSLAAAIQTKYIKQQDIIYDILYSSILYKTIMESLRRFFSNSTNVAIAVIVVFILIVYLYKNNSKNTSSIQPQTTPCNGCDDSTNTNTTETNTLGNSVLKLYYTEWCGWSQKFLPVWQQLESDRQLKAMGVKLVKINCDENKTECQNIPGFPYIILENGQNKVEFKNGDRNYENVVAFCVKNMN